MIAQDNGNAPFFLAITFILSQEYPLQVNGYIVDANLFFYIMSSQVRVGILAPQRYKPYPELATPNAKI